ncbi:hypothetical protein DLAC_01969 [Tieghemostelium lacteum]|uniref:Uncharacterized protein n=1 Tax=Tieghemostelium lacteum TaxID=361077 RepID=A0A152A563_TIELA|nr:hypothetical protein DLAC_01969 [Tieghemostelium lacteum]|eukprot:KYR01382.1 hypothetical protein DLAC_01969 [Tieghemostelium lacteum]
MEIVEQYKTPEHLSELARYNIKLHIVWNNQVPLMLSHVLPLFRPNLIESLEISNLCTIHSQLIKRTKFPKLRSVKVVSSPSQRLDGFMTCEFINNLFKVYNSQIEKLNIQYLPLIRECFERTQCLFSNLTSLNWCLIDIKMEPMMNLLLKNHPKLIKLKLEFKMNYHHSKCQGVLGEFFEKAHETSPLLQVLWIDSDQPLHGNDEMKLVRYLNNTITLREFSANFKFQGLWDRGVQDISNLSIQTFKGPLNLFLRFIDIEHIRNLYLTPMRVADNYQLDCVYKSQWKGSLSNLGELLIQASPQIPYLSEFICHLIENNMNLQVLRIRVFESPDGYQGYTDVFNRVAVHPSLVSLQVQGSAFEILHPSTSESIIQLFKIRHPTLEEIQFDNFPVGSDSQLLQVCIPNTNIRSLQLNYCINTNNEFHFANEILSKNHYLENFSFFESIPNSANLDETELSQLLQTITQNKTIKNLFLPYKYKLLQSAIETNEISNSYFLKSTKIHKMALSKINILR